MNYRIRYHPLVARDLDAIVQWIIDYAGPEVAARKRRWRWMNAAA